MNIKWDSKGYTDNFSFVHKYGEDVLELIQSPEGSSVVDLGCGNGALSQKLLAKGYKVTGIDASADMLSKAGELHSEINFIQADALEFKLEQPADVVFSNAVFHWIDAERQQSMLDNIASNLKSGGELVCEFGGYGCAEKVHGTLERFFAENGLTYPRVFYFPTIGMYSPLLEKAGFRVEYAVLFDRPTVQQTENGLEDWINMFVKKPFENISSDLKEKIIADTVRALEPVLFKDGHWYVDYVRIRFRAVKLQSD